MPQKNWHSIPDLVRAMPVKVAVKDGKIPIKMAQDMVLL